MDMNERRQFRRNSIVALAAVQNWAVDKETTSPELAPLMDELRAVIDRFFEAPGDNADSHVPTTQEIRGALETAAEQFAQDLGLDPRGREVVAVLEGFDRWLAAERAHEKKLQAVIDKAADLFARGDRDEELWALLGGHTWRDNQRD